MHSSGSTRVLPIFAALAVACFVGCAATVPAERDEFFDEDPPVVDFLQGLYGGLAIGNTAPEFAGVYRWLNSPTLTMNELREANRVVLIDFWTYTCVNCLRTLPFLADWDRKYRDHGLTIVGVHTPEFEFEKQPANVVRAVSDLNVRYAVAQDNDWETWSAYRNNVWPAKYLVATNGRIAYRHFGEGEYEETELAIRNALEAAGYDISEIPLGGVTPPALDRTVLRTTRELYFGYARNYHPQGVYAAQDEYYEGPDIVRMYEDPGPPRDHEVWYAHGEWRNDRESLVHARTSAPLEDYVTFRFVGRAVNPVFHPADDRVPYEVDVQLDGFPLTPDQAGPDVSFELGRSVVRVEEPRMYQVVQLPELGDHVLLLSSTAEGFQMFAVTFGAYKEGP